MLVHAEQPTKEGKNKTRVCDSSNFCCGQSFHFLDLHRHLCFSTCICCFCHPPKRHCISLGVCILFPSGLECGSFFMKSQ